MSDPIKQDTRSPAQKDAAEGHRDRTQGAPHAKPELREESHLGAAGDPAEGARDDD